MTSTTMRKHSRSAVPLPVAAVVAIIGLLLQPSDAFSFLANGSRKSFQSTAMTSRTMSSSTVSPLSMTFTMPVMPKLEFNAPSAGTNGAIWYESCVDPKARLPAYDEDTFAGEYFSFSSPSLDWPSAVDVMEASDASLPASTATSQQEQQVQRRRPIRAIRRAAGRALGIIPRLVHLSF
eukprot:CAMPEP_0197732834 /NCGR_PEP_ID=MMETSP1434-20131217/41913_1 /TAXON_ID=265543 /ORGANISM="Minutocellus polymorphus, Strain CCMP3303" /LENGTH=178 /DNA_ID=CAMNT_0043320111 /DNA_START=18 /DNA_END=554 /DNA_ORIENTATION=-